ncbi:MAG: M3 family metallopeptidase [Planctomycetota bacterium]
MQRLQILGFIGLTIIMSSFLSIQSHAQEANQEAGSMKQDSVLLKSWVGPYGGVPPWSMVNVDEFVGAFDAAIELAQREIETIASNSEAPTFKNTIVAMEKSGAALDRLQAIFGVHTSNLNIGPIKDIEPIVVPKLSQFADSITQNKKLFQRIETIYNGPQEGLTLAEKRLLKDEYDSFVRQGAKLNDDEKQKLTEINTQLAGLFTQFSQNVLHDEENYITWIDDEARLVGLPESTVAAMASAAQAADAEKAKTAKWCVTNTRSSMEPFLTYADDRELRKVVWTKYYSRGDNGGEYDTNQIITRVLRLRAQRAKLLGYQTHAHWRLEPQMAKTPENAMALMLKVWPKAVQRVKEEVADMQSIADQLGHKLTIEPWDYRYYAEKVRKAKFDLDSNEIKPYLQLERLRQSMMWAAGELYGFEFKLVTDVPTFHPDVSVYEVLRDGQHVGLWFFDPFARVGKRSGAWMTAYRSQRNIDKPITPIVSNNSNFIKGQPGEPILISWDDAITLFHEFGHALHGLCSDTQYPSQSGTSVARDYVEFPSQLNEHWLSTPEVLSKFAIHYETGEPMPKELLDKIEKAATFNQGFNTVEYLASALIDMKMHLAGDVEIDPDQFERETLAELGMPKEIVMRHRTPQFSHVFADDGYSAGYYSYLWSDALTADAAEVFEDAGSYYKPEIAKSLYDNIMSVGDTIDPAEGFRRFRGRDVDTTALLRKRGFPVK